MTKTEQRQAAILEALREGPMTRRALGEELGLDLTTLQQALARLALDGRLSRERIELRNAQEGARDLWRVTQS